MSTFVIDSDDRIIAFAPGERVPETDQPEKFKTVGELAALAESWPMARLIEIWNTIPGVAPVKKFTDRKTGIVRIWKAVQGLVPPTADTKAHPPDAAEPATEAGAATEAATERTSTPREAPQKAHVASVKAASGKIPRVAQIHPEGRRRAHRQQDRDGTRLVETQGWRDLGRPDESDQLASPFRPRIPLWRHR